MRRLPCAARAKPGPMRRFAAQGAAGDTATQSVTADAMQKNREPSPRRSGLPVGVSGKVPGVGREGAGLSMWRMDGRIANVR